MRRSILETLGSPLVQIEAPEGATVAAKLESFNPGGSAKDRPALEMVRAAERAGDLSPGDRLVEPTSGNTGIGLALVCAARGYDLTVVMPASKSEERRRIMRAYGAEIELVDGEIADARERAEEIAAAGAVYLGQFENEANPDAHYRTTGPELLEAVGDRTVDAFVAGVGTGGTISGVGRRLREAYPDVDIVAVEPERNAVLTRELGADSVDASDGVRSTAEAGADDYQGMGPGFVSENLDRDLLDDVITVPLEDAETECRRLAREEGILVGQSSGAASLAARSVAERIADPGLDCPPAGAPVSDGGTDERYDDCPLVVTVFPDSGERYLSAGLF